MDADLPPDVSDTSIRTHDVVASRRDRALQLHLAGATYEQIAELTGYATKSGAHQAVREALRQHVPESAEDEWHAQLARTDTMLQGLWQKARHGDVQAVDRAVKLDDRRAQLLRLLGMADEAPQSPADEEPEPEVAAPPTNLSDFERRLRERTEAARPSDVG